MYQNMTLIGNVGKDPEMRHTASGVPVTSFSVAVSRQWRTAGGEKQEKTTWFRVTTWRKLAEICGSMLTKGQRVLVTGEMEEASVWVDKQGNSKASLDVTAQVVKFLNSRAETDAVNQNNLSRSEREPDIEF